jgi:hypothetical protein
MSTQLKLKPTASSPPRPLFPNIILSSATLLKGKTGISKHQPMASDFSVVWQFSPPKQSGFHCIRIKQCALIILGASMPSFEMGGLNGVLLEGLKKAIDH